MLFDLCIPYFIFSCLTFFILNLVSKSIDVVLSSSKWMLRLLSTNQSKMFSESSFSFFLNFINIFKLTNKACIISINKKITLDSLWHIINTYEKEKRAKNRSLWYTTGQTCRLRK